MFAYSLNALVSVPCMLIVNSWIVQCLYPATTEFHRISGKMYGELDFNAKK